MVTGPAGEAAGKGAAELGGVERSGVGMAWRGTLTAVVVAVTVVLSFVVDWSNGAAGACQPTTTPVQRCFSAGVAGRNTTVSFSFISANASGRCCSPVWSECVAAAPAVPVVAFATTSVVAEAGAMAMAGGAFEEWIGWP